MTIERIELMPGKKCQDLSLSMLNTGELVSWCLILKEFSTLGLLSSNQSHKTGTGKNWGINTFHDSTQQKNE